MENKMVEIVDVEQGSPLWREKRANLLTASRVAAVFGESPFTSRKELIREMVREANGVFKDIKAPAMDWGNEHEDMVRATIELETGENFSDQRMRIDGRLGYSPDGVSEDGLTLLEVKCPYSKREDMDPQFDSVYDLPHYMHQIQMGMHITGADQCLFVQWAPNGTRRELVPRDDGWYEKRELKIQTFFEELDAKAADPEFVSALTARMDIDWALAAEGYKRAKAKVADAEALLSLAKEELIALAGENNTHGCGVSLAHVESKGRVNNKRLYKDYDITDDVLLEYRGEPSTSIRITETKTT
jgi:putative phage-type endonuclease